MRNIVIKALLICAVLFFPVQAYNQINMTDSVTITTYYPAPYGVYRNMRLYPSSQPTAGVAPGVMYFNKTDEILYVYKNTTARWQPVGGGGSGVSYTHYCFLNAAAGSPACPASVTIGTQGPCDTGFRVTKALGSWGFCSATVPPSGVFSYFFPPGGSCGAAGFIGGGVYIVSGGHIGRAYVCSQ